MNILGLKLKILKNSLSSKKIFGKKFSLFSIKKSLNKYKGIQKL